MVMRRTKSLELSSKIKVLQKVTLKLVSQAGQSICLSPGRRFIRKIRSHPGQEISTLATFGITVNVELHDAHLRCAGRLFTPTTRTFAQSGQPIFSSAHFFRVTSCSTRTRAGHKVHCTSPSSFGSKPSHFGHERAGGAIRDSTVNSSLMSHPLVLTS